MKNKLKQKKLILVALAAMLASANISISHAEQKGEILTGDTRLSCEALLCLWGGKSSGECARAIRKYYSIKSWKASKTFRKRKRFLELCPLVDMKLIWVKKSREEIQKEMMGDQYEEYIKNKDK